MFELGVSTDAITIWRSEGDINGTGCRAVVVDSGHHDVDVCTVAVTDGHRVDVMAHLDR